MVATKATSKNEINDLSCNAFKAVAKNYMTSLKEKNDDGVLGKPTDATNPLFMELAKSMNDKAFLESIITVKMPDSLGASGNPGAPVPTTAYDFEAQNVIIKDKEKEVKFYENSNKDGYLMSLKVLNADDATSIKFFCFTLSKATNGELVLADMPDNFDAIDRKDYPLEINETTHKDQIEKFKKSDAYITYMNYVERVDDSVAATKAAEIEAEKKAIQDALDKAAADAATAAAAELKRAAAEAQRIANMADAAAAATAQAEEDKKIADAEAEKKKAVEEATRKREEIAVKEKEERALAEQKKAREDAASGDVEAELGVNPKLLNGNNKDTNQKAILQFLTTTKVEGANFDKLKEVIKNFNAKQKDTHKLIFRNPKFKDKLITGTEIEAIEKMQGWERPKNEKNKNMGIGDMQFSGLAKKLGYEAK